MTFYDIVNKYYDIEHEHANEYSVDKEYEDEYDSDYEFLNSPDSLLTYHKRDDFGSESDGSTRSSTGAITRDGENEERKTNSKGEVIVKMADSIYTKSDMFDFMSVDDNQYDRYIPENDQTDDSIIYYYCYRCWNPFSNSSVRDNDKSCLNLVFHFILFFLVISFISIGFVLIYKAQI